MESGRDVRGDRRETYDKAAEGAGRGRGGGGEARFGGAREVCGAGGGERTGGGVTEGEV